MEKWSTPIDSSSRSFVVIWLDVAEHREAVADLVGDELAVLRADPRVLVVVVELPRLDVVGERVRDDRAVRPVALDQVLHVVRDHGREPARLLTALLDAARRGSGRRRCT